MEVCNIPKTDTEISAEDLNKVKSWPQEPDELVLYDEIYSPFKAILEKGYRLIRGDSWSFDYNGYEIGKQEKRIFPNIKEQLSEKSLKRDKEKNNQSLMDTVMRLMFLMGVEQGRRMAFKEQQPVKDLQKTLASYRERNKGARYQLARANAIIKVRSENSNLSSIEIDKLVAIELEKTRQVRLEEIRKEMRMDPTLNCFRSKSEVKKKVKMSDLISLANSLDPEIVKLSDWVNILEEIGCPFSEWKSLCKKKNFNKYIE